MLLSKLERNRKTIQWRTLRAILPCQNEDLLVEIGMLCLEIQKTFETVAL